MLCSFRRGKKSFSLLHALVYIYLYLQRFSQDRRCRMGKLQCGTWNPYLLVFKTHSWIQECQPSLNVFIQSINKIIRKDNTAKLLIMFTKPILILLTTVETQFDFLDRTRHCFATVFRNLLLSLAWKPQPLFILQQSLTLMRLNGVLKLYWFFLSFSQWDFNVL